MAGGRLIPDGAVIACTACDWSSPDLSARHECPNDPKVLQAKLEQAERERDDARAAIDGITEAADKITLENMDVAVQLRAAEADRDAWKRTAEIRGALLDGDDKPFREEIRAAESALAAAQGALREARARFRALGHLDVVNEGESCCDACDRVLAAEPRAAPPAPRHVHDGSLKCSCGAIGPFDAAQPPPDVAAAEPKP